MGAKIHSQMGNNPNQFLRNLSNAKCMKEVFMLIQS